MKYSSYPIYKESGIKWLGEIPSGWDAKRLKYISTVNDDILPDSTSENKEINYIDIGSVTTGYIQNHEQMLYGNAPSRAKRIVKHGDILVSTVRTYLKAIAPVPIEYDNYIASTGFAVIRSTVKLDSSFAKYALLSSYFVDLVESRSVGVSYPAINASEIMTFNIALPTLNEQEAIANYLDKATVKIDALIEKQTKLIELLQEKRLAVISTAVTRGLNSSVPMKDSGVEWLGEIPEHWKIVSGKRLFSERKGKALSSDEQLTASQKYGVIYQKDFMNLEGSRVTQVITGSSILKHAEKDDFVISMRSFQGGLERCRYTGSISSAYVALIPSINVHCELYEYICVESDQFGSFDLNK